jgi:hypothetical protein
MKSNGELNRMRSSAVFRFCDSMSASASFSERAAHASRRTAVERHCNRFFARMNSTRPFASSDEAVKALAPIAFLVINWAARQLAIAVIRWLWHQWHTSAAWQNEN